MRIACERILPPSMPEKQAYWIWGYAIMVSCVLAISLVRAQLFFTSMLNATSAIHHAMAERVARAPLSFFHTNPTGRILNRFRSVFHVPDGLARTGGRTGLGMSRPRPPGFGDGLLALSGTHASFNPPFSLCAARMSGAWTSCCRW